MQATSFGIALSLSSLPPPSPPRYSISMDMHTTTSYSRTSDTNPGDAFSKPKSTHHPSTLLPCLQGILTKSGGCRTTAGLRPLCCSSDFLLRICFEPSWEVESWTCRPLANSLLTGRCNVPPLGYTVIPRSLSELAGPAERPGCRVLGAPEPYYRLNDRHGLFFFDDA